MRTLHVLSTLSTLLLPTWGSILSAAERPNIIWISTEDLSPRWGCYGDKLAQTPNIDKIAAKGIRYTNAFTTAAVSAPVRAGIITGMYQTAIGCHHMRTTSYKRGNSPDLGYTAVPPHYVKAFTEYLRNYGYYCTNNNKTDYQFATSSEVPESIWDECGREAHYNNRQDKSQPFFAVFNCTVTHESGNFNISNVKTDPKSVSVPPYYADKENTRRSIAKSYDNIAQWDKYVGERLKELEESGELENSIIFLWGDHGDGFPRAKRWLYDSGTRIPLVIKFPDSDKARVEDRLVSSIDFGPTVLSLAGVPVPSHMQGVPFLGKQEGEKRDAVYAARDREDESYDMVRMVRNEHFLYIRNFYPNQPYVQYLPYRNQSCIMEDLYALKAEGKLDDIQKLWMANVRPPEELYDVREDPHNIHNLAGDPQYAAVLKEMRAKQIEWGARTNDQGLQNEDEMFLRMWPNGQQPRTDKPYYTINAKEERVKKAKRDDNTFTSPTWLDFFCTTQGASIVYRIGKQSKRWLLYNGPVNLPTGTHEVEVKAVRYGYKESPVVTFSLNVK